MGMSASQARFLCLTARKNNVEFEGQQINQQRVTLSNESASYYSELCNLPVPVPPSVDDFTKVSYTFNDGAMTNTISALLYDSGNNIYHVNYIQQWQDDYSVVPSSSSLVMVSGNDFYVGDAKLRKLQNTSSGSSGSGSITPPVPEPTPEPEPTTKEYIDITDPETGTVTTYEVKRDPVTNDPYYEIESSEISDYEESMLMYFDTDSAGNVTKAYIKASNGKYYSVDDIEQANPINNFDESAHTMSTEDEEGNTYLVGLENGKHIKLDDYGNSLTGGRIDITDPSQIRTVVVSSSISTFDIVEAQEQEEIVVTQAATGITDQYLLSLTSDEVNEVLNVENYYLAILRDYVGDSNANFYVRYVKNTTTGNYEPYFYMESELENAKNNAKTDRNLMSVAAFTIGSETKTKEVLNQTCSVEQDATGRYVALTMKYNNGETKLFTLNTITTTDDEAYNDAMNKYYYQQHEYDHKIQEINSKLEIIQQQDKQLELKLKQLDTEENAISTEMDAVKKVISKNVDSSFKTFSA